MTTIHGYAPATHPHQLSSNRTTLCGDPVFSLGDLREKVTEDVLEINCVRCLTSPMYQAHAAFKGTPGPDDHFTLPEDHVRALLQAVLHWRRQGAASRWTTAPSRALVKMTDAIREAFPALCEELMPTPVDSICGYVDCDQDPTVTLHDGARMCRHHALVSLAAGMSFPDVRAALAEADRDHMGEMARLAKLREEDGSNG